MKRGVVITFVLAILTPVFAEIKGELISVHWYSQSEVKLNQLNRYFPIRVGENVDSNRLVHLLSAMLKKLHNSEFPIAKIDSALWIPKKYGGELKIYLSDVVPLYLDSIMISGDTSIPILHLKKAKFEKEHWINRISQWMKSKEATGLPIASLEIDSGVVKIKDEQLSLELNVFADSGQTVIVSDVIIQNGESISQTQWRRESRLKFPTIYSLSKFNRAKKYLLNTQLFSDLSDYQIVQYGSERFLYFPNIRFPSSKIDGIIGYIPPIRNKPGYMTGSLDLSFYQLFRSFRKLDFHWSKPNRTNQSFNLSYSEPWLFQFPVTGEIAIHSNVRDTIYSEIKTNLNFNWQVNEFWDVMIGTTLKELTVDSLYQEQMKMSSAKGNEYVVRIKYDSRDQTENPKSGTSAIVQLGNTYYSVSEGPKESYSIQKIVYQVDQILPLYQNTNLRIGMKGAELMSNWNETPISDLFSVGGPSVIRGYLPEQYFAKEYGIATIEPRWLFSELSRTYIYSDIGYLLYPSGSNKKQEFLLSSGLGIHIGFKTNSVGFLIGWSRKDTPLEGKVTFQLNQRF